MSLHTSKTLVPLVVFAAMTLGSRAPLAGTPQAPARGRSAKTALDRYVAAPDTTFSWKVVRELPAEGATATLLEMTSQRWLTDQEVERPLWTHWITVVRPSARPSQPGDAGRLASDIGLLFITGGSLERQPPARPSAWLLDAARETGTVTAELRLVPNQPVVFKDDPTRKPRSEDDFIAYTWDKYLRTGDEKWPARLPMTKSAVRAMDAVTAFCGSDKGVGSKVSKFVVAGGSKRGWTTWTTAAVDKRVVAIVPLVIDLLNIEPSFQHHWRVYGFWAPAIDDYVAMNIPDWTGHPRYRSLMKIEEPYEYRERLTVPKLIINATGDQFFLPDSSQFYFDELRGEKHLRYVPNADHSMRDTDVEETVGAFFRSIVTGTPRPEFTWTFEPDGSIRVHLVGSLVPAPVRLWQATNPSARDFRLETLGPAWRSTDLTRRPDGDYVAEVTAPASGWTAALVELTFPGAGAPPLKLTTAVRVLPDTLPFARP